MKMKKILLAAIVLTQIFTVAICAQQREPQKQTAPRKIQYKKLIDNLGIEQEFSDGTRAGQRFVVTDVPPAKSIINYGKGSKKSSVRNLYGIIINKGKETVFLTSPAMVKNLRTYLKSDAASMRVTCVLIDYIDDYEYPGTLVYATKIEGLDAKGAVLWTANGTEPPQLEFDY